MNIRYRIQTFLFKKPVLVLQISYDLGVNPDQSGEPSTYRTTWRDATVEDLAGTLREKV